MNKMRKDQRSELGEVDQIKQDEVLVAEDINNSHRHHYRRRSHLPMH